MSDRRTGVFICYCGGNISDYVDVEKVRDAIEHQPGVVVAKTHMFACSDASQEEIIEDISNEKLDSIVIASCSPKLHLFTFRSMAERGDLNKYQYIQVNLREQCSWAHRDNVKTATDKAIRLVRAGIAKAGLTEPLSTMRIETKPKVLVIGAGVAGLRASLTLADLGLSVYLIERAEEAGGWTRKFTRMFPHEKEGAKAIDQLLEQVKQRQNITLFTNTELIEKKGCVGDFSVKLLAEGRETISLEVGAIVVTTGFSPYEPSREEFGYGMKEVVTMPEFKELIDNSQDGLVYNGRRVNNIVYIYCVGSRQVEGENKHCSRYCCSAAMHLALLVSEKSPDISQYHLYRDMRTYGKHEVIYENAGKKGSVLIRFKDEDPPKVEMVNGELIARINDQLAGSEELEIPADLVVLVTGMVPRKNEKLVDVLKLPIGMDGFFNEIHPKLRPVETVISGVFIAGAAQGPKTLPESVASALAAVAKSAALVMKGYVDLEPFIAEVDPQRCKWCDLCIKACPYEAVEKASVNGKEVARIVESLCKGGGACVPVCPENAIEIKGYTDAQVKAMIDAFVEESP